jgi:hypothetical protein
MEESRLLASRIKNTRQAQAGVLTPRRLLQGHMNRAMKGANNKTHVAQEHKQRCTGKTNKQ